MANRGFDPMDIRSVVNHAFSGEIIRLVNSTAAPQTTGHLTPPPPPGQKELATTTTFRRSVNYPVWHPGSDLQILKEHRRFQIEPTDCIEKRCGFVPYDGDKRQLFGKTGRPGFDVLLYRYMLPDDIRSKLPEDKPDYTVIMWDYNTGWVRTAPLFKLAGCDKSFPRTMVDDNKIGTICHQLTGGKSHCQGFWMPFEIAKELAIRICYDFRYALTPVFGNDFPERCIPRRGPTEKGSIIINPDIIMHSTKYYERLVVESKAESQRLAPATKRGSCSDPEFSTRQSHHPQEASRRRTRATAATGARANHESLENDSYWALTDESPSPGSSAWTVGTNDSPRSTKSAQTHDVDTKEREAVEALVQLRFSSGRSYAGPEP